jgi:hypothetical protein
VPDSRTDSAYLLSVNVSLNGCRRSKWNCRCPPELSNRKQQYALNDAVLISRIIETPKTLSILFMTRSARWICVSIEATAAPNTKHETAYQRVLLTGPRYRAKENLEEAAPRADDVTLRWVASLLRSSGFEVEDDAPSVREFHMLASGISRPS